MVTADEARVRREIERRRYNRERAEMTLEAAKDTLEAARMVACTCPGGPFCCRYSVQAAKETQAMGSRLARAIDETIRWRVLEETLSEPCTIESVRWAFGIRLREIDFNSEPVRFAEYQVETRDLDHPINALIRELINARVIRTELLRDPYMLWYRWARDDDV